jgi:general secretion pathway protein D
VRTLRLTALILVLGGSLPGESAGSLSRKARKAEAAGDPAAAFLYYAQAAALEPTNDTYWLRSQALRRQALLASPSLPPQLGAADESGEPPGDEFLGKITLGELEEARRPQPPIELEGSPGKKSFELTGDTRQLYERVAQAYGLKAVFDPEYPPGPALSLRIENAGYEEALRIVGAATSSFLAPISPRLFFVAKDTVQKRQDYEQTMAIVIPLPEPVSVQEAQELARAVQQVMEIQRLVIDSQQRAVLIRDRVSRVRPAQLLFEQMLHRRPEVVVELEFLEVADSSSINYGLRLPASFPLAMLGRFWNVAGEIAQGTAYAAFGGGATLIGLGLADAELFASMTRSSSELLLKSTLRSVHGQPATLHVGDKYPIMTAGYFGPIEGEGQVYTPPPSFNFEDLGMVVKVTPYVHGVEEVTLEVETEFKVLAGQAINGIPVIANRRFQGTTRLRNGEWAIVAGLVRSQEVRALSGLIGISQIPLLGPLFRQNSRESQSGQTVIVLKPRLVSLPPTESVTVPVWTGPEARPRVPI